MGKAVERFSYQHIHIDFLSQQIVVGDELLKLDPKAFKTLKFLIEHRDRVVSNEELIREIWDDRLINNDVVIAAIARIRKLFKNSGVDDEAIRTIHKVGYKFGLETDININQKAADSMPAKIRFYKRLNWALGTAFIVVAILLVNQYITPKAIMPSPIQSDTLPSPASIVKTPTQIFFLRHADVVHQEGEDDPPLSEDGLLRTQLWEKFFQHIQFDEVYTTDFQRTKNTAKLVAKNHKREVQIYHPLSFDIKKHANKIKGKRVLIMGHSKTIPDMVNTLIGNNQYEPMSLDNYHSIYLVNIDSSNHTSSFLYHLETP